MTLLGQDGATMRNFPSRPLLFLSRVSVIPALAGEKDVMTILLPGLLIGAALGYVLQRGRFCINTAFRDVLLLRDTTLLRAWAMALVIQIVGVQFFISLHLFVPDVPPFFWVANVFGGLVFGTGMVLAGGCGSGTCYRVGEGMIGSLIALLGFGLATVATDVGALKPLQDLLRAQLVQINGEAPRLATVTGLNVWMWIAFLVIPVIIWLWRSGPSPFQHGWSWKATGFALGVISLSAWLSSSASGRAYGLSITGPIRSLFEFVTTGDFRLLDWGSYLLIGLFVGSFLAARLYGEAKLRLPQAGRTLQALAGGLLMGFGAQVAGGCNIGHSFTGLSVLALSSVTTTAFIIIGAWIASFFLFMDGFEKLKRRMRKPAKNSALPITSEAKEKIGA